MKKRVHRLTVLALAALLILSLAACGGGGKKDGGAYKVDEVKTKLAKHLGIDESEINETERDGTTVLSYGSDGLSVDAYILPSAKAAQDYFSIPAMAGSFDDKRVDETDHKVWVSETENWATGDTNYNTVAMKDNFIILAILAGTPEEIVDAFDLK